VQEKVKKIDRSRPCRICGEIFTPLSQDGISKSKYTSCSDKCRNISRKDKRRSAKYSEFQLEKVKELKKRHFTNKEIVRISQVNLNTVKKIISENNLELDKKIANKNAYKGKVDSDPDCMKKMRDGRVFCKTNVFNNKIDEIKNILQNPDNKYSIPHISKKNGLNEGSVRRGLHLRGLSELIGKHSSSGEDGIYDFIKELLPEVEVVRNTRSLLGGKEIDIYIPSMKLAIEYCGLYWHTEDSPQPRLRTYHYDKMKKCESLGIRLITIFEDEWTDREKQVKNFLKSVLNVIDRRIYARDCQLSEVDKETAKIFLEDNHIQGDTSFKVAFGLYFKEQLVGLITANKHHRQGHDTESVLNRLVFSSGVQIVGGASKLLKYLLNYSRDNGYQKLISWSDSRWSQGNVYEKLGFKLEDEIDPDYSYYVGGNKRKSKQSCQKKNLIELGAVGNIDNTETELAKSLGYGKIYDCGKKRWTLSLI
jgi:hypothetical protein